jgi:phosphoglycerate dehydrogenase-like enzyme
MCTASQAQQTVPGHRHQPHEGPLRVLVGKERFSEDHPWSEMPERWPAGLGGRAVIEVAGQGQLEARLADGGPPVDLDAAADEGVWVANMAGLNAVPVAEHAVGLPEAQKGFEPGRWGEPAGRSLAGTAACVLGAGAIGTQIARRLAAFGVTVTGVRRHPPDEPVPPFAALCPADRLLDCVADVDSVIISATQQAGQPPLVDDTVLRAMRPGAWLVNIARGALLDTNAALAHLSTGHLAGLGLDVFPTEPYPADGPLVTHPRIVATAHTAP